MVTLDGAPWFVAADVCRVLGLLNTTAALYHLAQDEKGLNQIETLGGMQMLRTVSEPGLFRLVMRSDKPIARPFQDWVVREVLPAIRKTGGYVLAGADPAAVEVGAAAWRNRVSNSLDRDARPIRERAGATTYSK